MKTLICASLLMTSTAFAQSLDLAGLKSLMLSKKDALEVVTPGISKRLTTLSYIDLEDGKRCNYKQVADQSILKVQDDRVLVYSLQKFMPANTPDCLQNGYRPFAEKILFYDVKPTVALEIEGFELAETEITSINRSGNQVSIIMNEDEESTTFTFDMNRPLFKNLISTKSSYLTITGEDLPDVNPSSIDLTKVLFCDMEEGEASDCVEGDYSDFLFD